MGLSYCIIIPARYASSRFPGKPLAEIHGKSMIQRVYEAAASVASHDRIFIATDDIRIQEHAETFSQVIMTSEHHPSGCSDWHLEKRTFRCGRHRQSEYCKGGKQYPKESAVL